MTELALEQCYQDFRVYGLGKGSLIMTPLLSFGLIARLETALAPVVEKDIALVALTRSAGLNREV